MNKYLIPGLGGDRRMYAGQLDRFSDTEVLEFIAPFQHETISDYAKRLAEGIDKTQPFILIGVSLGGIIVQEIANIYTPERAILISTVKSREEMPLWMRFFKYFPLQKIIPGKVYLWAFMVLVGLKTMFQKNTHIITNLKNMAKDANPDFVYWAVDQIIKWQEPKKKFSPIHIHGNKDVLFPIKRIKNLNVEIKNGTHVMILTHVKEINSYLVKWLS